VFVMISLPQIEIVHLFTSPAHNFFGHHGEPAGEYPTVEANEIHCIAGRGIKGDRFFDFKENYRGQITFFAYEIYELLCRDCDVHDVPPSVFRRNVITLGADLNMLVDTEFEIQGIRFEGTGECSPCHWMNQAFHFEAEERLKGNGGLRARILTDGFLHVNTRRESA
jgi:MOSC domain-containing protein YiiM